MIYHDDDEKKLQQQIQETHAKLEQTSSIYNATLTMSHFLDFNEILQSFVKSQGGFPASTDARDDHKFVSWDLNIYIFQVIFPGSRD